MSSSSATPTPPDPSISSPEKETEESSSSSLVGSFVADLASQQRQDLERCLQTFVLQHAAHHRPIALVTSGGTAADLEIQSVRCLDNFSTGTRGAASIEALLRKGYAVIHLWRTGSASPFARLLAEAVGLAGNQGISTAALGKLFVGAGDSLQDEEDRMVQSVLDADNGVDNNNNDADDPWMTDPSGNTSTADQHHRSSASASASASSSNPSSSRRNNRQQKDGNSNHNAPVVLHRRIENSSRLQMALRERQSALQEGRLLTVPFRSIEEYLAKLYLCSTALRDSQTLALVYLAAAVSDFYVPKEQRSQHKIQSSGGTGGGGSTGGGGLTLTLEPVPKVMGLLRSSWAPDAFVCSFKLETDSTLLRHKAERAVQKYGCHMVVGNLLETRYTHVQVLAPPDFGVAAAPAFVSNWPMHSIHKPNKGGGGDPDSLENQLVDMVVQTHFEYISTSGNGTLDKAGTDAVLKAHYELEEAKRQRQREMFWEKVKTTGLEWAGVAAGALLSYAISTALRRRMGA